MERNFETVMIEQCAPVLAGLKPAGLFRYETRDCADLARRVRSWNEQLASKGLSVRVLKGCVRTHQFLIYVYREARLRAIFADEAVRAFLAREGYQLPQSRGKPSTSSRYRGAETSQLPSACTSTVNSRRCRMSIMV